MEEDEINVLDRPGESLTVQSAKYAVKLMNGKILLIDKDLKIQHTLKSTLSTQRFANSHLLLDGNNLITCGEDGVECWDISKSPPKRKYLNKQIWHIFTLAHLPNNRVAAAGQKEIIYILDGAGRLVDEIELGNPRSIACLLWVEGSNNGQGGLWITNLSGYIYIAEELKHTRLRQLETLPVHPYCGTIYSLLERKSTQNVLSSGCDGKVGVWDYEGILLYKIVLQGIDLITSFSLFGGNNIVTGDSEGNICVASATTESQRVISRFTPHKSSIRGNSIQGVKDTQLFITGGQDKTLKLIDPINSQVIKELALDDEVKGMNRILKYLVLYYGNLYIYIYILDGKNRDITQQTIEQISEGIKNNPILREIKLINLNKNSINLLMTDLITTIQGLTQLSSFKLGSYFKIILYIT